MLVRGSVCTVLATRASFLQERRITNNVAEFSGLVGGLELARDFLAQSADPAPGLLVTVRGDSRLVIDLVQDRTEGRDPALLALADQRAPWSKGWRRGAVRSRFSTCAAS